nr:hypothetical protein [Tanacetum cinerariifolium]
ARARADEAARTAGSHRRRYQAARRPGSANTRAPGSGADSTARSCRRRRRKPRSRRRAANAAGSARPAGRRRCGRPAGCPAARRIDSRWPGR